MAFLKKLINSFKKKETKIIDPKVGIAKVKEEINTAAELRKQNIEKQKKLITEINYAIKNIPLQRDILTIYSKILAREILITETFINRLKRETNRPIVVVAIESTGIPYTWSIKNGENIILTSLKYSSCSNHFTKDQKTKLNLLINKYNQKLKNPLFVFIDSSTRPKMPSSFTGCNVKHICSINKKDAIKSVLKKEKPKFVGDDWSLQNNQKYLPNSKELQLNDFNTILFNPVGKGKNPDRYSALHDDDPYLRDNIMFKNLTKKRAELLKLQLFGD